MKPINKINSVLEIPREVCTNQPKLILTGFNELQVENYKGILEYEDYYIKLETYIGIININGTGLRLDRMTEDSLKVRGKIETVDIKRM